MEYIPSASRVLFLSPGWLRKAASIFSLAVDISTVIRVCWGWLVFKSQMLVIWVIIESSLDCCFVARAP